MAYPADLVRAVARGESVAAADVTSEIADSAIEHRMSSLLLRALDGHDLVANESVATLLAFDMAVSSRRGQQDRVLELVHQRLEAAGVTHTFVKGPVSAMRWFDPPTDRPYSDIDVVVPRGPDFLAAVEELQRSSPAIPILRTAEGSAALDSVDVFVEGVHIDIQTDALRTGLKPKAYGEWSVGTAELGESRLRVLDAEHDLIMFVLHQGRDRFRFLLGAAELRLRLNGEIDWDRLEAIARREGIWEQVAVGLEVLCEDAGRESPVAAPSNWRTALWRRLWQSEVRCLGEVGRIRHIFRGRWLMPLLTKGRALDGLRYMARSIFPPEPLLRLRYPKAQGPYLWRVLSLRLRVIGRRRFWVWRHREDDGSEEPGRGDEQGAVRGSHRS